MTDATLYFCMGIIFTMACAFVGSLFRQPRNKKYCPKCGRILLIYDPFAYSIDVTLRKANESHEDFINRAKRDNLGSWVEKQTEN